MGTRTLGVHPSLSLESTQKIPGWILLYVIWTNVYDLEQII